MNSRSSETDTPRVHGIFVERARSHACDKGLSLTELVETSTISEDRLLNIFDGKATNITLREIAGISLALGVSLEALLGFE